MSLLLHISDPHFGTERPQVVEALLRLVQAQPPTLVVLSGDITQRATRAQFAAAGQFVAQLGRVPVITIPGNHDIPLLNPLARLCWPYANHCRVFGPELEPSYVSDDWLVLCLNTTRNYRHQNGEVSGAQIERVARQLAQATPRQLRVVVTHQPVAVTQDSDRHDLLRGHREAIMRWSETGADIVLGGHIHLPFVQPLHTQQPLPRPMWAVQAGTAVSARVRREAGNSVNLIYRSGNASREARVERWDYAEARHNFECVTATTIEPDAH
jgi:3',5'-cyclic AMP phosphodiesterase CpdA